MNFSNNRTNRLGKTPFRWYVPGVDEIAHKQPAIVLPEPIWHAGFGLTASPEWMHRALGYLPEHFMGELIGFKQIVLTSEDVQEINSQAPDFPESFQVHGLRYTSLPEDKIRAFFWKLDPKAIALITEINQEVGFSRVVSGVDRFGQDIAVCVDIVPDSAIGRKRVREDPLFLNGRDNSLDLANRLHKIFYPSNSEGQVLSASRKELE